MHTDCWQHSVCTIEEEEGCGASQPFSAAITASFIVIAWHFTNVAMWLRGCPMITESAGNFAYFCYCHNRYNRIVFLLISCSGYYGLSILGKEFELILSSAFCFSLYLRVKNARI